MFTTVRFPEFNTEKLLLRHFKQDDLENVFRGLSHPEVIKYYGVNFKTSEETQEQIEWYADLEKKGTGKWWAICKPDNSEFFGGIGINNLSTSHKKAELGYWLLPDFWGKGIIKEAAREVIKFSFDSLGLHRIEAFVEAGNSNSEKLLQKLAFNYEGTMEDCEVKNGNFISLKIFALINK